MLHKFVYDIGWDYQTYERQLKKFIINEYEDQIVYFQKKFENVNQLKENVKSIKLKLIKPINCTQDKETKPNLTERLP